MTALADSLSARTLAAIERLGASATLTNPNGQYADGVVT